MSRNIGALEQQTTERGLRVENAALRAKVADLEADNLELEAHLRHLTQERDDALYDGEQETQR